MHSPTKRVQLIWLVVPLVMFSCFAWAAVAVDGVGTSSIAYSGSASHAHDGGTGSDRMTIACVVNWDRTDFGCVNTGATYNSVAMTEVDRQIYNNMEVVLYYLKNSAMGSNTLATTWSNLPCEQALGGLTFTGVNQTAPVGTVSKATGTGTAVSVAPASSMTDLVVDCLGISDPDTYNVVGSVGAGQTERWQQPTAFFVVSAGSTEPGSSGMTTMSWMLDQSEDWATIGVAIQPTVTARRRVVNVYP